MKRLNFISPLLNSNIARLGWQCNSVPLNTLELFLVFPLIDRLIVDP